MHILHLSDLHFGTRDNAELWHGQLAHDLKSELGCRELTAMIISGDLANYSTPEEYEAAGMFITRLMEEFKLDSRRVVLVPGNHDLNRLESKKQGYDLIEREDCDTEPADGEFIEVGDGVIRLRNERGYPERFKWFSQCYQQITGRVYSADHARQGIISPIPGTNIVVLGLNSAWQIDHHFKARASINDLALNRALEQLRQDRRYADYLKIAVWHHPLNGPDPDRITEHGFLQRLAGAGFSLALHGHIHKASSALFQYDKMANGRAIEIIGAGTFGAPVREWHPGYPLQYNLLVFAGQQLTVRTRRRQEVNGAWKADPMWEQGPGMDPKSSYEISLPLAATQLSHQTDAPHIRDDSPLVIPEAYRVWLLEFCKHMDIDRFREKGKVVQVDLPELFIPLYAQRPCGKEPNKEQGGLEMLAGRDRAVNIEELILEFPHLLIKGRAGSGKSTLLRHFCYERIREDHEDGLLPILILLKDLQQIDPHEYATVNEAAAETILDHYLKITGNGLDPATIKRYCRAGKAVFLVDGLDEIDRDRRDLLVTALAAFRLRHEQCKMVFCGRPHGFEGAVIDRFGEHHVEILPLTMEQVEEFSQKWFCTVTQSVPGTCNKSALDMMGEIKAHPAINELKDTPLMLTAICMLYLDGKELPGQRAELYKKFIEFLVYRRFPEPETVLKFLQALALTMHLARKRSIDRMVALDTLRQVSPRAASETVDDHDARIEREFDHIEPHCGILQFEHGKHMFWHLSIQEFLAASALVDKERKNYVSAIENFWEDEWFREVVELYIGYLSIQNSGMANEIVRRALAREQPTGRARLAARGLYNIHRARRESEVVALAGEKLLEICVSGAPATERLDAGETLGRLGDPRDLKRFIPIPGGDYLLGEKRVSMKGFEMAKYPVSNQWFAEFIRDKGYENPLFWSEQGKIWLARNKATTPRYWHNAQWNCPNAPVVGVCWYEAHAFVNWLSHCDNAGYRYFLPSEEQWWAAAAGPAGRKYPWGDEWREDACNGKESGLEKIAPLGIFPNGDTPEGIVDLAGNVWEWTCSDYHRGERVDDFRYDPEAEELWKKWEGASEKDRDEFARQLIAILEDEKRWLPVLRGGSWGYSRDSSRCATRERLDPSDWNGAAGFRCSRIVL